MSTEALPTWESTRQSMSAEPPAVSESSTIAAPEPQSDTPAEVPATTESTTPLETTEATQPTPQPDAEKSSEPEAVREGEESVAPEAKPEDDYVPEADDPPEIAALTTPSAKKWAKRQYKEAKPTHLFHDMKRPIGDFAEELWSRSESRYTELVNDLATQHADYLAQTKYGVKDDATLREMLEQAKNGHAAPTTTPTTPVTTALNPDELGEMTNEQIVERFNAAQTAAAEKAKMDLQKEFDTRFNELKSQFETVNGEIKTQKEQAKETQVKQLTDELYAKVYSVADERVRDLGLEVKADDSPKVKGLKEAALDIIRAKFEPTFDADEENVKVVERVLEAAKRLERNNVFREEDNLKVRARSALDKVQALPQLKTLLDELEAQVRQSKTSRLGNPPIPAPGASAAVNIKPPSTWEEARAAIASAPQT